MSDVVEERRRADVSGGVVVDPQPVYRAAREVVDAQRVLEAGVVRGGYTSRTVDSCLM